MKSVILAILMVAGFSAFASKVECVNATHTSGVTYVPETMTMEFSILNGINPNAKPMSVAIVGEPKQINPETEWVAVYLYKLADGRSIQIIWEAGQSEILRNITSRALNMRVFDSQGELESELPSCRWVQE